MIPKLGYRRYLSVLGGVLAAAGVFYVILRFWDYSADIDLAAIDRAAWFYLAICLMAYALANFFLAVAWSGLLKHFGANKPRLWVIKTYGVSQIAKYVPGNVFHLAGRHVLGMAEGIASPVLAKSLFWELVLLAVAGSCFVLLATPLFFQFVSIPASLFLFLLSALIATYAIKIIFSTNAARAVICYLSFLSVAGLLFSLQYAILTSSELSHYLVLSITASFVVAWLAGFLTPGAPAGIGVREVVLLFLLGGIIADSDLLLAVIVGRIVSAGGDLLFFLGSAAIKPNKV